MLFKIRIDHYHHYADDGLKQLISSTIEECLQSSDKENERLRQLIKKIEENVDARPKT